MRALAIAASLVGLAVLAFFAFDPSYQQMRDDRARYERDLQLLDLARREQLLAVDAVGSRLVLGGLAVAAVLVAVIAVDAYLHRRRPLVQFDDAGRLPVARSSLVAGGYDGLLVGSAAAAHQVAALRAVHQPGQSPHSVSAHYAPHLAYSYDNAVSVAPGAAGELVGAAVGLPVAPSWSSLRAGGWSPSPDRMLLGYSADGALYGSVDALLSTAIAGRPGQGKSTLLRFIYAQLRCIGAEAEVWDLHGSIAEDVRGCRSADTVADIEASARRVISLLDERIKSRSYVPHLILIDEWPSLALASRDAVKAAARIVLEGRKRGMYALIAGQGLPADRFGGSLVRDALSSRYVFKTSAAQARMAGLVGDEAALVSTLMPGFAVLAGPVDTQIVAIPEVLPADLEVFAEVAPEVPEVLEVAVPPALVLSSDQLVAEVQRRAAAGEAKTLTIRSLWLVSGGRRFREASQYYDRVVGQ